ncbi:type II toxin-antitoxin system prevent-host-death family antitoxin [bacterium]|nr:type II toxin-antitoxin system prevent-host-death family antitoxin [bacterium]
MQGSIHEAETRLSQLIAAVERGEEVVITRRDQPGVRLVMESLAKPKRTLGFLLKPGQPLPNFDGFFDRNFEERIAQDFHDAVEADKHYQPGPSPE